MKDTTKLTTLDEVIELLCEIREEAVYNEIIKGNNDSETNEFQFHWGMEEAVCRVLNRLDIPDRADFKAFERGRDRAWAEKGMVSR